MTTQAGHEERITKLLRKAESTTPEEAEALTAKAEELMIRYGIEQARLDARLNGDQPSEKIVTETVHITGIYHNAWVRVGSCVARGLGTVRMFRGAERKNVYTVTFIGFESDAQQAARLFTSLMLQGTVALRAWWANYKTENPDTVAYMSRMAAYQERRAFVIGFGTGVEERLTRVHHQVVKEETAREPGTELVLADRAGQVDSFYDTLGLIKTRSRLTSGYGDGVAGGRRAGLNANTGETQVGERRPRLDH